MPKGIQIGIASETKAFKQGIDAGVIAPLEDAQQSLKDLGRDRSLDKLEDNLQDAQKASQKLEKETKQTADAIEQEYRKSYAKLKTSSKEGFAAAGESTEEFKQEANATAKETAASFDGSAESIVGAFQEVAANAFGGFGPAGAAAGLAAAAGIGLVVSGFQKAEEANQKLKEHVAELGAEFIETGGQGQASIGYIVDKLKEMATETDDTEVSLATVRKRAKELGVPFKELALTYAGGTDNLAKQIKKVDELIRVNARAGAQEMKNSGAFSAATIAKMDSLDEQKKALEDVQKATADARQEEADWVAAGGPAMEQHAKDVEAATKQADDALAASTQVRKNHLDAINTAYDTAGTAVDGFLDKESGLFNLNKWNKAMEERQKAITNYGTNLVKAGFTPDEIAVVDGMGFEAGSAFMQAYVKGSEAQRAATKKHLDEMAKETSGSYMQTVDTELARMANKRVVGPTVTLQTDTSSFDAAIRKVQRGDYVVGISLAARNGKPVN